MQIRSYDNGRLSAGTQTEQAIPYFTFCALVILLFIATHDVTASLEVLAPGENDAALSGSASLSRQAALACIGICGLVHAVRRTVPPSIVRAAMPVSLVLLVLWSGLSLCWSADPMITVRALVSTGGSLLFAFGFAGRFGARMVLRLCLVTCLAYLLVGITAEVVLGTFHPFSSQYRFAGTLNPNHQAFNCSLLLFASACADNARYRAVIRTVMIGAGTFLLMTRSRTAAAGTFAAFGLLAFARLCRARQGVLTVVLCIAGILYPIYLVIAPVPADSVAPLLLMGREEETPVTELTGRSTLWEHLRGYVAEHPWLGYGYHTFWTPARHLELSDDMGWGISDAHSAYLDTVLSIGVIGLALFVVTLLIACFRATGNYLRNPVAPAAFPLLVCTFSLFHGATESSLLHAGLLQIAFLCCVMVVPSPKRSEASTAGARSLKTCIELCQ